MVCSSRSLLGTILKNDECVRDFLHDQGNRDPYITTFLAYLHTLGDTYSLVQRQILSATSIQCSVNDASHTFNLDAQQ